MVRWWNNQRRGRMRIKKGCIPLDKQCDFFEGKGLEDGRSVEDYWMYGEGIEYASSIYYA